jgi:uncharacterized lipoprotein
MRARTSRAGAHERNTMFHARHWSQMSVVAAFALAATGCTSLSGMQERYLVCPYETVWDAALETMKDRPLMVRDKATGAIETDWMEMDAAVRSYGMFGREASHRERARMTLYVKKMDDVTSVSLSETREVWHRKGGVTSQATKWWPVDPSEEAMAAVLNRLNAKLKERGCSPS